MLRKYWLGTGSRPYFTRESKRDDLQSLSRGKKHGERESRIIGKQEPARRVGLEKYNRGIPECFDWQSGLANRQHAGSVCAALVHHVLHGERVLVAHVAAGASLRWLSDSTVYYLP